MLFERQARMTIPIGTGFTSIPIPPTAIKKASEVASPEFIQRMEHAKSQAGKIPSDFDGIIADNHPSNLYATIMKDGEVFAQVYKSGGSYQPNKFAISEEATNTGGNGKSRADARVAQFLRLSGGEVTYGTQSSKRSSPPPPIVSASTAFMTQLLSSR